MLSVGTVGAVSGYRPCSLVQRQIRMSQPLLSWESLLVGYEAILVRNLSYRRVYISFFTSLSQMSCFMQPKYSKPI